jgi:hypothetical protein
MVCVVLLGFVRFCIVFRVLQAILMCVSLNSLVICLVSFPLYVNVARFIFSCCGSLFVLCFIGFGCVLLLFLSHLLFSSVFLMVLSSFLFTSSDSGYVLSLFIR